MSAVIYDVALHPPGSARNCWSACAIMLLSWARRHFADPQSMAVDKNFQALYESGPVMKMEQADKFLSAWGLVREHPMHHLPAGLLNLLNQYGPLIVSSWTGPPGEPESGAVNHARLVTGFDPVAMVVSLNDPWSPNAMSFAPKAAGFRLTMQYQLFVRMMNNLSAKAQGESSGRLFIARLPVRPHQPRPVVPPKPVVSDTDGQEEKV